MATYRDKAQRRHDVFLVEDMQKKSVETYGVDSVC